MSHVSPGSPAEKAGVKRGDVIVSFDGKEINEMKDLDAMQAKEFGAFGNKLFKLNAVN